MDSKSRYSGNPAFGDAKKAAKVAVGRVIIEFLSSKGLKIDDLPKREDIDGTFKKILKRENFPPNEGTQHKIQSKFGSKHKFTLQDWENFKAMKDMEARKAFMNVILGPIIKEVESDTQVPCTSSAGEGDANSLTKNTDEDIEGISAVFANLFLNEDFENDFELYILPSTAAGSTAAGSTAAGNMNERRGARRFKQHGGGVVSAIKNLFSTIIQRSGGYIITSDNISGATIGQVSDAIATTQHGTLTRILLGGIGTIGTISTMLTGNNHAANLALAAINILNQVIGTVPLTTIMANSISGITAWVPVAGALVPLAAKFSIIGACFIAIRETNKFVLELGRKEAGKLTQMEFKELLVELCKRIFSILMRGGTGVIQARLSAANSAAAAGGGGAPPVKTPSWFSTLFSRLGGGGASEGGGGGGKCHVITAKEQEAIEEVGGQIDTFLSGGEEGEKQEGKNILSALETLAIEAAKRSPLPVSSSSSRVGGGGGGGGGGGSGGGLPKRRQFGGKRSTKKVQKKSTKKSKRKSRRV